MFYLVVFLLILVLFLADAETTILTDADSQSQPIYIFTIAAWIGFGNAFLQLGGR